MSSQVVQLPFIAGLRKHGHRLDAYCPRCNRRVAIDLAAMVAAGLGNRRLPLTVRCGDCGEVGRLQVRPPVPNRSASVGWISVTAR